MKDKYEYSEIDKQEKKKEFVPNKPKSSTLAGANRDILLRG